VVCPYSVVCNKQENSAGAMFAWIPYADYLKYDNCGILPGYQVEERYTVMRCAYSQHSIPYVQQSPRMLAVLEPGMLVHAAKNSTSRTCPSSLSQYILGCRNALNATGRPIYFSLCEWGVSQPELWGALPCH